MSAPRQGSRHDPAVPLPGCNCRECNTGPQRRLSAEDFAVILDGKWVCMTYKGEVYARWEAEVIEREWRQRE